MSLLSVNQIRQQAKPILKAHGVKRAAVFGSIARGDQRKDSDIDMLVELPDGKSLLDLAGLKIDLEDHLGHGVDILTYGSVHPLLRMRINAEQQRIL